MKTLRLSIVMLVTLSIGIFSACGSGSEEEIPIIPDPKADGTDFAYGFYSGYIEEEAEVEPVMLVLHNNREGLPNNFAGHFDFSEFSWNAWEVNHTSGVFKLYRYGGKQRILFQGYDGSEISRRDWSFEDGKFVLDGIKLYRLNLAKDDDTLIKCQAVKVHVFEFEESFTVEEYPSVRVDVEEQGLDVSIGMSSFDEEEGNLITVETDKHGNFRATVTTDYGSKYVIEVPNQPMLRGKVLYDIDGQMDLMADIVCAYIPEAKPEIPCVSESTVNECWENYEEWGEYYEGASKAENCAGWAMEDISICGMSCYLDCDDFGGVCDEDGQFEDYLWDAIEEACLELARSKG